MIESILTLAIFAVIIFVLGLLTTWMYKLSVRMSEIKTTIDSHEEKMAKINGLYCQLIKAVDKQALKEFREMDAAREKAALDHEERLRKDMEIVKALESKLACETDSESDKDYLSKMELGTKNKLAKSCNELSED